jgi:hypothetical protein
VGALIKFLGGTFDDLPPARARLFSVNAQIAGVEAKVGLLADMKARLEDELSKKAEPSGKSTISWTRARRRLSPASGTAGIRR